VATDTKGNIYRVENYPGHAVRGVDTYYGRGRGTYVNSENDVGLSLGESFSGIIVFQVPQNTEIKSVEYSDSTSTVTTTL